MMMMRTSRAKDEVLHIDLETYCDLDLAGCGVFCYAAHPSFRILLIGYALGDGPVEVADLTGADGEEKSRELKTLIERHDLKKCAHNAAFEMTCLRAVGVHIDPSEWIDTMALANYAGLPPSLAALTDVLALGDRGKLGIGSQLIRQFCRPCAPSLLNGNATRNLPDSNPEAWAAFVEYNRRDVEAEREVYRRLKQYDQPETEHAVFRLDYKINARGIRVDDELAHGAMELSGKITTAATARLVELTGLSNPASVPQFKSFLARRGFPRETFTKADAEELLSGDLPADVREAVSLKMTISKAAIKKYYAVTRARCPDGTVKGMFQYYGSHTGRWAGRLVQLQNLRRNSLPDLDLARDLVKGRDLEGLELAYDGIDPSEVLGQLIRTVFVPTPGNKFIIADYSAIEARVIAWLARESWRQEVFAHDGDIYKSSYSQAFGVPVEKVTKPMRQKGKIMELALGFGGGVGAMKRFGADKLGLTDEELRSLVTLWRQSSPRIVALWRSLQDAATAAVSKGSRTALDRGVEVGRDDRALTIKLPSGRTLYYQSASVDNTPKSAQIVYSDVGQATRRREETRTYGGKLTENVVQAIARDCLASAMLRLDRAGYAIVSHIHDEVIIDAPQSASLEEVEQIMGQNEPWAKGLHLTAKGYENAYYRKD